MFKAVNLGKYILQSFVPPKWVHGRTFGYIYISRLCVGVCVYVYVVAGERGTGNGGRAVARCNHK